MYKAGPEQRDSTGAVEGERKWKPTFLTGAHPSLPPFKRRHSSHNSGVDRNRQRLDWEI